MADIGAATREVNIADLEMQIAQQQLNLKAQNLRKRQLEVEIMRMNDSENATKLALVEIQARLDKLLGE